VTELEEKEIIPEILIIMVIYFVIKFACFMHIFEPIATINLLKTLNDTLPALHLCFLLITNIISISDIICCAL